jgi:Leucine Rich repeat
MAMIADATTSSPTPRPPRARWRLRFSLRALFVFMTLVSVFLGTIAWRIERVWNQRRLKDLAGQKAELQVGLTYDYQYSPFDHYCHSGQERENSFCQRYPIFAWLGDDFFHDIVAVYVYDPVKPSMNATPVTIENSTVEDSELANSISNMPRLRSLKLQVGAKHYELSRKLMSELKSRLQLERLSLQISKNILCDFSDCLKAIPNLEKLELRASPGPTHKWDFLQDMKKLRELEVDIDHIQKLNFYQTPITLDPFEKVGECRNLFYLSMCWNLSNKNLQPLTRLERLEYVDFNGCQINDEACAILGGIKNLLCLELNSNPVTDIGVRYLANCQQLYSLAISDSNFSGEHWENAQQFQSLRELNVANCPLTPLGLQRIHLIPKLNSLHLANSPLNNVDFESVVVPTELYEIIFHNLPISEKTFRKYLSARPDLRLELNEINIRADLLNALRMEFPDARITADTIEGELEPDPDDPFAN